MYKVEYERPLYDVDGKFVTYKTIEGEVNGFLGDDDIEDKIFRSITKEDFDELNFIDSHSLIDFKIAKAYGRYTFKVGYGINTDFTLTEQIVFAKMLLRATQVMDNLETRVLKLQGER